jgi:hypothetical protein
MSQGATISIMMIMVMVVVGLGIYLMNAGTCSGPDSNASYKYNDEGECVIDKCNAGYVLEGNVCITDSCSGPDLNASYKYNDDGDCVFDECNEEFFLQDGLCLRRLDVNARNSENFSGGGPPVNCQIRSYTWGQCISDETGQVMSGIEPGNCGKGNRTGTAYDYDAAINGGSCEDFETTEECEVTCPKICPTDAKYYTPVPGTCMSGGNKLSTNDDYCGTGTQQMILDKSKLTDEELDGLSRDDYFNQNWKDCPGMTTICSVECTENQTRKVCPETDETVQMSYVVDTEGNPICFKKEIAQQIMRGENVEDIYANEHKEPDVSAKLLWDENENKYIETNRPTGYKIKFRANSPLDQSGENCAAMILEDCGAPVTHKDCEYEINGHITKSCGLVEGAVCGQYFEFVQDKVTRPAYEGGSCETRNPVSRACTINDAPSVDCCAEVATGKWTAVTGDEGCFLIDGLWKRKHTRTGHDSCAQKNVDFITDTSCIRENCILKSIDFEPGGYKAYNYTGRHKTHWRSSQHVKKVKSVEYLKRRVNHEEPSCGSNLPQVGDAFGEFNINTLKSKAGLTVHEDVGDIQFKCGFKNNYLDMTLPGDNNLYKDYEEEGFGCGDVGNQPPDFNMCGDDGFASVPNGTKGAMRSVDIDPKITPKYCDYP